MSPFFFKNLTKIKPREKLLKICRNDNRKGKRQLFLLIDEHFADIWTLTLKLLQNKYIYLNKQKLPHKKVNDHQNHKLNLLYI